MIRELRSSFISLLQHLPVAFPENADEVVHPLDSGGLEEAIHLLGIIN